MPRWAWAAIATILATALLASAIGRSMELPARDLALRLLPARPATHTAIIAIDEKSIAQLGRWPWSRAVLAQLVDRAADAGARGVAIDILLSEPGPGDEQLARAAKRLPVIAVSVLDEHGRWLMPSRTLGPDIIAAHGNFELDRDGILRRFAATKQSSDRALTAIPVEAASIVTSAPVPVGKSIAPAFRTRPRDVPQIGVGQALQLAAEKFQPPDKLRACRTPVCGRIVFIGPTAFALGDRVLTPVSPRPEPGVTVHAAATESVIRGEEVRELPPIVAGLIAGAAVWLVLRWRWSAIAIVMALASLITVDIAAPFVTVSLAMAIAISMQTIKALRQSRVAVTKLTESRGLLAHELKTPLASMRGLTQLLAGFELTDAERRRVTTLLESEAGKLQSMVDVLLDLERLPQRDFEASTSVIDLGALAASRVEFLQASTERTLSTSIAPRVFVRADAALLERVIDNLAGNALKYTSDAVNVAVHQENGAAFIDVDDRGPGISHEDRERIFQRFFRGSSAAGTQGLGLGLSFVAEVARWHGGSVSMEPLAAGGSRFRFAIPIGVA
ncbi:MAG TPA: CHASE2 domain-containing protein [Thermoanaerobaculia bacterium]|nr:CHASE2 domain-containing protein [Thermoanaerobaculia bacterium]